MQKKSDKGGSDMLDKGFVKKLTLADCQEYMEANKGELTLTKTRLERLKKTQENNPSWEAYDKYADDFVGIDIRIEEQYAVFEWLEAERNLITEREDILKKEAAHLEYLKHSPKQLSLFDTKGVLC